MIQQSCPAAFLRGGTSKGVFFLSDDLPDDDGLRDQLLLRVLGSPDPNGRQLDGMGGGISSLSKAMIVEPSARDGIDVDYLFGQIVVDEPQIDYSSNCGNLSAAIGVFAIERDLVPARDGEVTVRMFNLNTRKRVDCVVQVRNGHALVNGGFRIAGVAGSGAPIRLDFLDPGGAATGVLLPTGQPVDTIELGDGSAIQASIVDASAICVYVRAADMGLSGTELPAEIRSKIGIMQRLEAIRCAAAVMAGIVDEPHEATRRSPTAPRVAMVAPARESMTLSGERLDAEDCDIQVRMLSMGAPHLAIPLTGAMCTGVAAQIAGTLVHECARRVEPGAPLRIGHGSGALPVAAEVSSRDNGWFADKVSVFRTARMLMDGQVFAPVEEQAAE